MNPRKKFKSKRKTSKRLVHLELFCMMLHRSGRGVYVAAAARTRAMLSASSSAALSLESFQKSELRRRQQQYHQQSRPITVGRPVGRRNLVQPSPQLLLSQRQQFHTSSACTAAADASKRKLNHRLGKKERMAKKNKEQQGGIGIGRTSAPPLHSNGKREKDSATYRTRGGDGNVQRPRRGKRGGGYTNSHNGSSNSNNPPRYNTSQHEHLNAATMKAILDKGSNRQSVTVTTSFLIHACNLCARVRACVPEQKPY